MRAPSSSPAIPRAWRALEKLDADVTVLHRTSHATSAPADRDPREDIDAAADRIGTRARRTPVIDHDGLVLKLECLQHAGSFKTRGAFNRVLSEPTLSHAGVIAASGGNHGAAVAHVGAALGITTEIFLPSTSPTIKRRTIERFGATVHVIEGLYDDAQTAADLRRAETGATMIHPYDHPATVAGQGTMGRELADQTAGFDTLIVAAGGGGFIAGQAAWFRDDVRIVCVEPETSQCVRAGLATGEPTDVAVSGVAADSLGARRVGAVPWELISQFVDEAVAVSDDVIRAAQHELWEQFRLVVEPGGAAALAAVRTGAYEPAAGERVVVVVRRQQLRPQPSRLERRCRAGPGRPSPGPARVCCCGEGSAVARGALLEEGSHAFGGVAGEAAELVRLPRWPLLMNAALKRADSPAERDVGGERVGHPEARGRAVHQGDDRLRDAPGA